MAAAPTLTIDAHVDIRAAGTDSTVTPDTDSIKPTVAGGQAFDLTLYPNLRAVQIHAINGTQPLINWSLALVSAEALAADTPDGECYVGGPGGRHMLLSASFGGTAVNASFRPAPTFDASAWTAPSVSYALDTPFNIGDGALKDYFQINWAGDPCAVTGANEQPTDPSTDQRQTLYVPAGTQSLYFGVTDTGGFSDNSGSAIVSLMLTMSDDTATTPVGSGTTLNVIANDTIDGSTPVLGSATASVSTSAVDPQGNAAPWPAGITLNTATGDIQVAATVAPGTYPVWYQLCDNPTSPASCALARATVTVRAAPSAQSVPTLSEMALLLLAALLGLSAVFVHRRGG